MITLSKQHAISVGALVYVFLIVILTFSPCQGYVPLFRQTWIFYTIGVFVSIFLTPSYYNTKQFFFLLIYFVILYFNSLTGDELFPTIISDITEIYFFLFPSLLCYYAINKKDGFSFGKMAIIVVMAIIIIETIASFALVTDNPGIIREIHSDSLTTGLRNEYLYPFFCLGLSNYFLPHAVPMLIPPLMMVIRNKREMKIIKVLFVISLVSIFLLIWLSGSMTALMLGIIIFIISLLSSEGDNIFHQKKIIISAVLLAPIVFSDEIKLYILVFFADLFSSNHFFHDKLMEFEESIAYGHITGDFEKRDAFYTVSYTQLMGNIILGTNQSVGNHSSILDRLAVLGIVGFIPLVLFCYYQLKMVAAKIDKNKRVFFYESVFAGLLMLLAKDMDVWESFLMLFAIMPITMLLFSTQSEKVKRKILY